jgi:regulatory protein
MQNKKLTYTVEEAKRKLEKYCIYQERCHKEIEQKLSEIDMIQEAKDLIIIHLIEHDFVNEERYAKSFARGKFRIKKWGKQRIIKELKFKGISEYNIKSALKEINEEEYFKTLMSLAKKKFDSVSEKNSYKKSQKITNFLLYRGFENNLVYEVVKEVSDFEK